MTVTDDFIPGGDVGGEAEPNYPVVFGITFTPMIQGILIAILGLGGAIFLLLQFVLPEWDTYNQLRTEVDTKNAQLQGAENLQAQIDQAKIDLETAEAQSQEVLTLFADQQSLDTLLLDINRQVQSQTPADIERERRQKLAACPPEVRNNLLLVERAVGPFVVESKIKDFTPNSEASGIIEDDVYGEAVINKLKRQVYDIEMEASFDQTRLIMQRLERLQPLLVVKNAEFTVGTTGSPSLPRFLFEVKDNQVRVLPNCQPEPKVTSKFRMEALLPLTDAEAAKIREQEQQAQQQPQ